MALIIQVFKSSSDESYPSEWSNEYVIDSAIDSQGDYARELLRLTCAAERTIHLPHVTFNRATIQTYAPAGAAEIVPDAGALSFDGVPGLRDDSNSPALPWRFKLQTIKAATGGRHGRLWYAGCLKESDTRISTDERYHLANPDYWLELFGLWFMYHFDPVLPLLVVPQGVNRFGTPQSFAPVWRLLPSAVVTANAMNRAKPKVKQNSLTAFNQQRAAATLIASARDDIDYWVKLETEFNPPDLKMKALAALATAKSTSENLSEYLKDADLDDNNGEVPPVVRYGANASLLRNVCMACGNLTDEDQETIQLIQPYHFVQDQYYLHLEDAETLLETVKKYVAYAAKWSEFDWLNPAAY